MTTPMTLQDIREIADDDRTLALALLFRYAECARAGLRSFAELASHEGPYDNADDMEKILTTARQDMCGDI